ELPDGPRIVGLVMGLVHHHLPTPECRICTTPHQAHRHPARTGGPHHVLRRPGAEVGSVRPASELAHDTSRFMPTSRSKVAFCAPGESDGIPTGTARTFRASGRCSTR